MKKTICSVLFANLFAVGHDFALQVGYGFLMPFDKKHEDQYYMISNNDRIKQRPVNASIKNPKYADLALYDKTTGFGIMYSRTTKGTNIDYFFDSPNSLEDHSTATWHYSGYYLTYKMPVNKLIEADFALGAVKQKVASESGVVPQKDISAKLGLNTSYSVTKKISLKFKLNYHYFVTYQKEKEFYYDTDGNRNSKTHITHPNLDVSGLSSSLAIECSI